MITIPVTPDPLPDAAELRRKYREAACLFAMCYPRQEAGADKILAFEKQHQRLLASLDKLRAGEIQIEFCPQPKRRRYAR